MTNALEIEGLTKIYGDGFEALKGIDLPRKIHKKRRTLLNPLI